MVVIYIIYHHSREDTNVFTTDETKIPLIIRDLSLKYNTKTTEWSYEKIYEGQEFEAKMEP
jgi:hypothetical protein